MKLHSPKLEKAIKQRVRAAIRLSPSLKREAKRLKRTRHFKASALFWRLFVFYFIAMLMVRAHNQGGLPANLFLLTLLSSFSVCLLIGKLFNTLYRSGDLNSLFHLPISDSEIFRWQGNKFLRNAMWSVIDVLFVFGVIAVLEKFQLSGWLMMIPMAVLQWLLVVATALLLAAYVPRFPYAIVAGAIFVTLFIVMVAHKYTGPLFFDFVQMVSALPYWIIPNGWPAFMMKEFVSGQTVLGIAMIIPVAALLFTLPKAIERLRRNFSFIEPIDFSPENIQLPLHEDVKVTAEEFDRHIGPTEIEDHIRSDQFLKKLDWEKLPFIEKTIWGKFTGRERTLAEFLSLQDLNWTASWKKWAGVILGLSIATQFDGLNSSTVFRFVFFALGFFAACWVLPFSNPLGRGFQSLFLGGINIPFYAGFPISYADISRLVLKISLARSLAAIPLLLCYGLAIVGLFKINLQLATLFAGKIFWLLLAVQPLLLVTFFSGGTNDTQAKGGKRLALLIVFGALAFLGCGATFLFAPIKWAGLICAVLAPGISFGLHQIYRRTFNRLRFDLMQIPQQNST